MSRLKRCPFPLGNDPLGAIAPSFLFCAVPVRWAGDICTSIRCHGTQALFVNVRVIRRQSETCCWLFHYRDTWGLSRGCVAVPSLQDSRLCTPNQQRRPFVVAYYCSFSEQADEHQDSHDRDFVGNDLVWVCLVPFFLLRPIDVGRTLATYERGVSRRFSSVCSATRLVPRTGFPIN